MKKGLRDQIDELAAMNVAALQQRHKELFGDGPVSAHRQFLFRKIAWRMQADREGSLPDSAHELARAIARDAPLRIRVISNAEKLRGGIPLERATTTTIQPNGLEVKVRLQPAVWEINKRPEKSVPVAPAPARSGALPAHHTGDGAGAPARIGCSWADPLLMELRRVVFASPEFAALAAVRPLMKAPDGSSANRLCQRSATAAGFACWVNRRRPPDRTRTVLTFRIHPASGRPAPPWSRSPWISVPSR